MCVNMCSVLSFGVCDIFDICEICSVMIHSLMILIYSDAEKKVLSDLQQAAHEHQVARQKSQEVKRLNTLSYSCFYLSLISLQEI